MAYDPLLLDRMDAVLADRKKVERKRMFGGFCWMLNGNMLCGVETGRYMFRVGKELEGEALDRPGTAPVIFNARKMGGIIWVDAVQAENDGLKYWIAFAERFVGALPVK